MLLLKAIFFLFCKVFLKVVNTNRYVIRSRSGLEWARLMTGHVSWPMMTGDVSRLSGRRESLEKRN